MQDKIRHRRNDAWHTRIGGLGYNNQAAATADAAEDGVAKGTQRSTSCASVFGRTFLSRKHVLAWVMVILIAWRLSWNKFAPTRKGFVEFHCWALSRAWLFAGCTDLSEGAICKNLPSRVDFPSEMSRGGCVWDVGANNGIWHSNSHHLIHFKQFHAWLFEPDASTFLKLRDTCASHSRVRLHNFALGLRTGVQTLRLFPMGFENTIRGHKHDQADEMEFSCSISVQDAALLCQQQRKALAEGLCVVSLKHSDDSWSDRNCTALSVDAEGADWAVFTAAHGLGCRWDLVILEGKGDQNKTSALGHEFVMRKKHNFICANKENHGARDQGE